MSQKPGKMEVVPDWVSEESQMNDALPAPTKPTGTQIKLPILLNPQYYPRANVLEHELKVREVFQRVPQAPHPERAAICLQVFEELLPKLSTVFQPTFEMILKEMDSSVFAEHYTSAIATSDRQSHEHARIHRVPYFILSRRSNEKRDQEMIRLKDYVLDLEQKLKFREKDINVLVKKNLNLRNQVENLETEMKQLKEQNDSLLLDSKRHQAKRDELKSSYDVVLDQMKSEISSLQGKLEQSQRTVQKLSSAKGGYNDMEAKMAMSTLMQPNIVKKTLRGTATSFLKTDIDAMLKLKNQIALLVIEQMDEYENGLWEITQKYFLMQANAMRSGSQSQKQTSQSQQLITEQGTVLKGFKKRVQQCLDEFSLLTENEKHVMVAYQKWNTKEKEVQRNTDAFRRDAIQLTYSTDVGKTYELHRESPYCTSCNIPSMVLCPHQVDYVYEVKLWDGSRNTRDHFQANAWTNIRFERPQLTYVIFESAFDSDKKTAAVQQIGQTALATDADQKEALEFEYLDKSVSRRMRSIWRDFYVVRGGKKPENPRTITPEKLLWFIDEFYRVRVMLEEAYVENFDCQGRLEDTHSELGRRREALGFYRDMPFRENLLDCFYEFLKARYPFQDLSMQVMYELLLTIQKTENEHRAVRIFVRQLYGDSDINWKYLLFIKELTMQFEPLDLSNYRKMVRLLFPYRSQNEFYEQLELDDVSYTHNRMTVESFNDRLHRVLLQHREPNIMGFQIAITRDLSLTTSDATTVSLMQLQAIMGRILPPCPSELIKRRWDICLKNMPKKEQQALKTLPVHRAASMGAYALVWCLRRWGSSSLVPSITNNGDALVSSVILGTYSPGRVTEATKEEGTLDYMEKEEALLKQSQPEDVGDILDAPAEERAQSPEVKTSEEGSTESSLKSPTTESPAEKSPEPVHATKSRGRRKSIAGGNGGPNGAGRRRSSSVGQESKPQQPPSANQESSQNDANQSPIQEE